MRSEKDDRRVKYTKMVLKESLIKLLGENELSQISVTDICKEADVNRATFYSHYSDPFDLMRKIENELFDNLTAHLAEYTQNDELSAPCNMVERILEYLKENASLCKLLLSERGNIHFQKRVMMLVSDKTIDSLTGRGSLSKEDAEYMYLFIITGTLGVLQKWMDEDMVKPIPSIAKMVIQYTSSVAFAPASEA